MRKRNSFILVLTLFILVSVVSPAFASALSDTKELQSGTLTMMDFGDRKKVKLEGRTDGITVSPGQTIVLEMKVTVNPAVKSGRIIVELYENGLVTQGRSTVYDEKNKAQLALYSKSAQVGRDGNLKVVFEYKEDGETNTAFSGLAFKKLSTHKDLKEEQVGEYQFVVTGQNCFAENIMFEMHTGSYKYDRSDLLTDSIWIMEIILVIIELVMRKRVDNFDVEKFHFSGTVRVSQNLCKPPLWCIIGASQWRLII